MKILEKLRNSKIARCFSAGAAGIGTVFTASVTALAAEGDATATTYIKQIWDQMIAEINVGTVVAAIGIGLGVCLTAVMFWYGIRYLSRKGQRAVKTGKFNP